MIILLLFLLVSSTIYADELNCWSCLFGGTSSPETELPTIQQLCGSPMMRHLSEAELEPINVNPVATVLNRLSNDALKRESTSNLQRLLEQIQQQAIEDQKQWDQNYDSCCWQSSCAAITMPSVGTCVGCLPMVPITPLEGCILGGLTSIPCCVGFLCYYIHIRQLEIQSALQYKREIEKILKERTARHPVIPRRMKD